MKSTPPIARLRTSRVFGAVCPTYWPTSSSRVTATRCPRRHEAEPGPLRVHQEQRGDLPDPGLDRGQPDQLAVQGIQDGVHAGLLPGLQKVDRPTLGQLLGGSVKWHYPWCT